ncbi:tyrosine-type recombinase/integrase, partial [Paraburkholderia sp. SIMBA_055]
MIDATPLLYNYRSPQQASMYRTLILLLYGSGLRIGEALRLTILDADLIDRVITVHDTKFFKTRLVPIGQRLST